MRNKSDPHGTLRLAKQVRIVDEVPGDETLASYNEGDLVVVSSTGQLYRVISDPTTGARSLELLPFSAETGVKPFPKYLHYLRFDDSYDADANAWYDSLSPSAMGGACSAIRRGAVLGRNYDWNYDEAAEFVVGMGAAKGANSDGSDRHSSVGVASLGAALTESEATGGTYTPKIRALPGMTLDGINDSGVVAEINVVPRGTGDPVRGSVRNLHPLAVVRHVLDRFSSAEDAAEYVAARYYIPSTSAYSFHWMIADASKTFIVEDGTCHEVDGTDCSMTNHRLYASDVYGTGYARKGVLDGSADVWSALSSTLFTNAYATGWPWPDEFSGDANIPHTESTALREWADAHVAPHLDPQTRKPKARDGVLWHTVHSSVYDIASRTLAVSVQESGVYFVFSHPGGGGALDDTVTETGEAGVKSSGIWSFVDGVKQVIESKITPVAPSTDASDTALAGAKASANFVNSSINAFAAFYITADAQGNAFATKAALNSAIASGEFYNGGERRVPTKNDYLIVREDESVTPIIPDVKPTTRYSYDGAQWAFQYIVNNTALTQAQVNAINSGITSGKTSAYDGHLSARNNPHGVTKSQVGLGNVDNTSDLSKPVSTAQRTALDKKQDKLVSGTSIKTVNDQSLLGSGNIEIEGSWYTPAEVFVTDYSLLTDKATANSFTVPASLFTGVVDRIEKVYVYGGATDSGDWDRNTEMYVYVYGVDAINNETLLARSTSPIIFHVGVDNEFTLSTPAELSIGEFTKIAFKFSKETTATTFTPAVIRPALMTGYTGTGYSADGRDGWKLKARFIGAKFNQSGSASLDPTMPATIPTEDGRGLTKRGIWGAIWGALTALPTGFTSLYDWVVAKLVRKANAELVEFIVPYELDGGDGLYFTYIVTYKDGIAHSINGWWSRNIGEKLDEFTAELSGVIDEWIAIQKFHIESGVFYAVEIFREDLSDRITVKALRGEDVVDTKYFDIEKVGEAYSVVESIERRIIAPSLATASGKAADALAAKNELADKLRKTYENVNSSEGETPWEDKSWRDIIRLRNGSDIYDCISRFAIYSTLWTVIKNAYYQIDSSVDIYIGGNRSWNNFGLEVAAALKADLANFAPEFVVKQYPLITYAVGDFVTHNGKIYQCISATNSQSWNASKWSERNLSSLFGDGNAKLVETIEAHGGGGGDTTFCLKYDPENDVLYYDDGEPETSNQGE